MKYLTIKEAVEKYPQLSKRQLENAVQRQQIPFCRSGIGSRKRITVAIHVLEGMIEFVPVAEHNRGVIGRKI